MALAHALYLVSREQSSHVPGGWDNTTAITTNQGRGQQRPSFGSSKTAFQLLRRLYVLGYPPGLLSEMSELGAASGQLVPEISGFTVLDCPRRGTPGPRLMTTTQGGQTCIKR